MIHHFLFKLPGMLFEPVAAFMVWGICVALWREYRKKFPFYWIVAFSLLFCLVWRLCLSSRMISSRYSSFFLYPAAAFAVYGIFSLPEFLQKNFWLKKNCSTRIFKLFPWVVWSGLVIASLLKTLHYDPYAMHTIKICKVLKNEIAGKDVLIFSAIAPARVAYYANRDLCDIQYIPRPASIKAHLLQYRNSLDHLYFVFSKKNNEPEIDASFLGITPSIGNWECLHREYTSRRKNKEVLLCRFIPAHPNIEEWHSAVPELPSDTLVKNGDFEHFRTGKQLADLKKYLANVGYFCGENGAEEFPADWFFEFPPQNKLQRKRIKLSAVKPLAGNYSLFVYAPNQTSGGFYSEPVPRQKTDCNFQFFVRNDGDTQCELSVNACFWFPKERRSIFQKGLHFWLKPGQIVRIFDQIRNADFPAGKGKIFVFINGTGKFTMDQFSITSLNGQK